MFASMERDTRSPRMSGRMLKEERCVRLFPLSLKQLFNLVIRFACHQAALQMFEQTMSGDGLFST